MKQKYNKVYATNPEQRQVILLVLIIKENNTVYKFLSRTRPDRIHEINNMIL